jgi:CRISPR-associated protein Csy3
MIGIKPLNLLKNPEKIMSKKIEIVELPSLLSFERKLEVSDGVMYSGDWESVVTGIETLKISKTKEDGSQYEIEVPAWKAIPITKRQNRSTQSAYGIDPLKKSEPNPVASDSDDANLPMDKDTLRVSFTLRIIGNLGKPFACNNLEFKKLIFEKISAFKEEGSGLETLACRYAYNIANARFLWRNRVCAEKIEVRVSLAGEDKSKSESLKFDATDYSLNDFNEHTVSDDLKKLQAFILKGFNGDDSNFVFMTVNAYAKIGNGQHVFPSQEMNMGEKKKVLFQLNNCAAIHNVKIGNAIRTIDNWYEAAEFPIAVEPYGSVTQIGYAFRKSKNDVYTLLVKWFTDDSVSDNDKNYVVANLIRGGLFQGENEKNKKDKNKKDKNTNEKNEG